MSAIVGRGEFGTQILHALGMSGRKVQSIDLHIAASELVTATVKEMVQDGQAARLVPLLTQYELHPKRRPGFWSSVLDDYRELRDAMKCP